jgi:AcrR family transcriptional regulator
MTRSAYHHGGLAPALIAAALEQVEKAGAGAVSMRELAQALNVSHAAPSRHFADRDALLVAVAARGFEDLIALYQAGLASPGDGRTRLRAVGQAFFDFAARRPNLYRLMFESDFLSRTPPPSVLIAPAEASYRLLWRAMEGAYPQADEVEIKMRTLTMISTGHGFLALDNAGRFKPFMYEPMRHEDVVEAMLRTATGA